MVVDRANAPERRARLALLPAAIFAKGSVDDLEQAAQPAMHIELEAAREGVAATGVKVDLALVTAATELRERMLKTADYNLGDREAVAREIADIRSGTGYLDLANDCVRLAALFRAHKAELAADKRHYDADDAKNADALAVRIRAEYRAAANRGEVFADLRPRAFTELTRLFNEVRAAALFVFRDDPAVTDEFPPLRSAVIALAPARRAKKAPGVLPPGEAPGGAPAGGAGPS